MKLVVVTMFDKKSQVFHPPYYHHSLESAKRQAVDMFRQNDLFSRYPEDFELYLIGSYDDHSGKLMPVEHKELLATGEAIMAELELRK